MISQNEFLKRHAESIIEAFVEGRYSSLLVAVSQLKDDVNLGLETSEIRSVLERMAKSYNFQPQNRPEKIRLSELNKALLDLYKL